MNPESTYREFKNLNQLFSALGEAGCTRVLIKTLAENDNSKNQVYFGSDFQVLNDLPSSEIAPDQTGTRGPKFKASLDFFWINADGSSFRAPGAQLILYPQYPEVRFSGFLQRAEVRPSDLMTQRQGGRILLMGVSNSGRILGHVTASTSPITRQINDLKGLRESGVFRILSLVKTGIETNTRQALIRELRRIHLLGWIVSKRLDKTGKVLPCHASNCGGYTLEAELGVRPSGESGPDYLDWEIKSYKVDRFASIKTAKPITLMTPEPKSGFYAEMGFIPFLQKYGYPDTKGRKGRLNFSSPHHFGDRNNTTNLQLMLLGFNSETKTIVDACGSIALVDQMDKIAASWDFSSLMEHWNRKHNQAAYVPRLTREAPTLQYSFGPVVGLGEGTDFIRFLEALSLKHVYYDPGIHVTGIKSGKIRRKKRSQFRIRARDIEKLYYVFNYVELFG